MAVFLACAAAPRSLKIPEKIETGIELNFEPELPIFRIRCLNEAIISEIAKKCGMVSKPGQVTLLVGSCQENIMKGITAVVEMQAVNPEIGLIFYDFAARLVLRNLMKEHEAKELQRVLETSNAIATKIRRYAAVSADDFMPDSAQAFEKHILRLLQSGPDNLGRIYRLLGESAKFSDEINWGEIFRTAVSYYPELAMELLLRVPSTPKGNMDLLQGFFLALSHPWMIHWSLIEVILSEGISMRIPTKHPISHKVFEMAFLVALKHRHKKVLEILCSERFRHQVPEDLMKRYAELPKT